MNDGEGGQRLVFGFDPNGKHDDRREKSHGYIHKVKISTRKSELGDFKQTDEEGEKYDSG